MHAKNRANFYAKWLIPVLDIVNLMLHCLCAYSGSVIMFFFPFSLVVFLLVAVLYACVTMLRG